MNPGNKEKTETWFLRVWNERRWHEIPDYIDTGCSARYFGGSARLVVGPEGFLGLMKQTIELLPDLLFNIVHIVEEGRWTATHWIARGHHEQEEIVVEGVELVQWCDGRMVSNVNGFDLQELQQLLANTTEEQSPTRGPEKSVRDSSAPFGDVRQRTGPEYQG